MDREPGKWCTVLDLWRAQREGSAGLAHRGLLRMARRGFRWAAVVGTGGHYAGAGWMELERRRNRWLSHAYRVFTVRQSLASLVDALNAFDPAILTAYPSALELLAEEQLAGRLCLRAGGGRFRMPHPQCLCGVGVPGHGLQLPA